jgi:hypothetical protein
LWRFITQNPEIRSPEYRMQSERLIGKPIALL